MYSSNPSRCLPKYDSVETDPRGFLGRDLTSNEVTEMLSSLNNGKANCLDRIANEALKNLLSSDMIDSITILFNKIKSSGSLPKNLNRGRVTLVHKYGQRELLKNYCPIVISLCGLYSILLYGRLM